MEPKKKAATMLMLKAGAVYFALVFGTGFVLGTIRTIWVVPRLGTRTAELMEMPIMLAVTILAARWTVLHRAVRSNEPNYFWIADDSGVTVTSSFELSR